MIRASSSLRKLDVSWNSIGDAGAVAIAAALGANVRRACDGEAALPALARAREMLHTFARLRARVPACALAFLCRRCFWRSI